MRILISPFFRSENGLNLFFWSCNLEECCHATTNTYIELYSQQCSCHGTGCIGPQRFTRRAVRVEAVVVSVAERLVQPVAERLVQPVAERLWAAVRVALQL